MTVRHRSLIAFAAVVGVAATCFPAAAQFWGDRYPGYYQQGPFPFFGNGPPPPVVDSTKAPQIRKLATPPTSTIVVIGDSMADWLGYGLDETYSDQPDVGVERKIRATAGLIHYDTRNDTLDWPQVIKDALATETPNAIVIMLGLNDRIAVRDKPAPAKSGPQKNADQKSGDQKSAERPSASAQNPPQDQPPAPADTEAPPQNPVIETDAQHPAPGGPYEFHTDQWAAQYSKRIDEMIAALKSKGVPVLWVGLPALRGTKSTADMAYLDELYRERAEKAGIVYVDIWDGFVDDQGRYAVEGPDFEGQTRRLRTGDGVHFTKAGAVKLASYVDLELRRVMLNHVLPVALPGPEEKSPVKPGAPRPDVGPVLPLTTSSSDAGGLLGAGGNPPPAPDPVAAKVLSRGDPIPPAAGRADDFSWPRPANDMSVMPVAVAPEPLPLAPGKKGPTGIDGKKPADTKKDAKGKPTADLGATKIAKPPAGGF